ncbi:MAG: cytochrome c [Planctomycetota bacterium]|nr:cytochrome c [Planctomycetota bacterium]
MKFRFLVGLAIGSLLVGSSVYAQRSVKKPKRAAPPTFKPNEFSGVFFSDALSQLSGELPSAPSAMAATTKPDKGNAAATNEGDAPLTGKAVWKELISAGTLEDLVKESKTRLDGIITNPAGFQTNVGKARREFTLIAASMAVIAQYPEEIRWQSSAAYSQRIFARTAINCKVPSTPVFNEAKQRQQDLQNLLKGSKLSGNAEEVTWEETADRSPSMILLEWSIREHLLPYTSNEKKFRDSQEDVIKFAELIAMFGNIIQQPGMTDADVEEYQQFASVMTQAAVDAAKAARSNDADLTRSAVSRIDQACNKCHETYK